MKGTIAILGCLLAAYAAPLFANEVPLILEETIQLPVATPVWDVAPTWSGEYYWTCSTARHDSICSYYWGTMTLGVLDTVFDSAGNLDFLRIWFLVGGEVAILSSATSSWAIQLPPYRRDLCIITVNRVSGGFQRINQREIYSQFTYQMPHGPQIWDSEQAVAAVFVAAPPPDQSDSATVWVGYQSMVVSSWQGGGSTVTVESATRIANVLNPGSSNLSISGGITPFESHWVGGRFEVASGLRTCYGSNCNDRWGRSHLYHSENGQFVPDSMFEHRYVHEVTTFGEPRQAIVLTSEQQFGNLEGWTRASGEIWSIPISNARALSAYVLDSYSSEQFLLQSGNERQLQIVIAETGEIWGQTSPLDAGFSEMKIIGRYHNETRRLVVRYGSVLRIYRFGDPILDADDARPELPSDLTLSAYPNPFNPTTMIAFDLPKVARASLVVYDLNGRLVQTLLDEQMSGGYHEFGFDGASLPSGIYFARLSAGELVKTQKMVLLK